MKNLKKHEPTWTQLTLPLEYLPEVNQNPIKLNHGKASRGVNKANINRAVIIEESCTTARAAELLKISPTTLYRAKNQGQSYRRDRWTAIWLAPNSWQVMHDRT